MRDISQKINDLFSHVYGQYDLIKNDNKEKNKIQEDIMLFTKELSSSNIKDLSDDTFLQLGQLVFFYLVSFPKYQNYILKEEIFPLLRKLKTQKSTTNNKISSAIYTSLITGLDILNNKSVQAIINELNDILDVDLGNTTPRINSRIKKGTSNPDYFGFLSTSVIKEVISFLKISETNKLSNDNLSKISEIKSPVISTSSRKGGSGKTTFLLNTVNWFYENYPDKKACIIDLDLSGPVWQYLLTNDNQLNVLKSSNKFIDTFFTVKYADKPDGVEIFENPTIHDVENTINDLDWPFNELKKKVGLCTFRDIPYTNRLINSALNYKRDSFYTFLINYIAFVSEQYDLILIDSGPGFSSIPFCTMSIAGIAEQGIPIVMSSPAVYDLLGTLYEFGDLRFINLNRPPIWWVNKVRKEQKQYFDKPKTWIQLSEDLGLKDFNNLELIKKLLNENPDKDNFKWNTLSFDDKIYQIGLITETGQTQKPIINSEFILYNEIKQYFDNSELSKYFDNKKNENI